ncbi:MAG: hypothetical protein HFE48_01490 [Clostridia bacterium]|nr:hypothetical protein [Clostridia bacterium]
MIELKQVLLHHIDEAIRGDEEAIKFIGGFVKNIPGEVLDVEIDESAVGKQAQTHGSSIYNFGIYPATTAFIEYFETSADETPSMALYADRARRTVTVKGSKDERKFFLCYDVDEAGEVHKTLTFD